MVNLAHPFCTRCGSAPPPVPIPGPWPQLPVAIEHPRHAPDSTPLSPRGSPQNGPGAPCLAFETWEQCESAPRLAFETWDKAQPDAQRIDH
jgi:hypothetical protein